ncbi:MAG: hypothetical protein ACFFE2_11485 [Candidatus Thorarchaeota archaeon]
MGETYRGSATPIAEQRTDQMIVVISISLVLVLVVGGFVVAANLCGSQSQSPTDDDQEDIVMDCFDSAETAQLRTLREPVFVMESESGSWGPLDTEQGYIDFYDEVIPSELPLCLNNETMANWYVEVFVFGGYKPWEFGSYIDVWQKGVYQGRICVQWTHVRDGPCCASDYWRATFFVRQDICLESNKYPDVTPWDINYPPGDRIPGKYVTLEIMTYWTGCHPGDEPSQDFTIIHSHSNQAFSKRFILTLQTHILSIHLDPEQSVWYYTQTALVQHIFEIKNVQRRSDNRKNTISNI